MHCRIAILPATPEDVKGKRYLAYITADKVGLHSLPLDGNPHNAMAFIAHPQGVSCPLFFLRVLIDSFESGQGCIALKHCFVVMFLLKVGNLCCSYDGKYLFTAGGNDASVHMWSINIT